MNKTVNANIGGVVFHIEEDAYEKLRKYLDTIKANLSGTEGRDEIMQDIEARIAELFNEELRSVRQVITPADLEVVIDAMGQPGEVAGNDHQEGPGSASASSQRSNRRLYRDPDDKVIGGVCSGVSHYIGIDPVWLRLVFAATFFIAGAGFWLYIILLVILPKARTTAEKLEMKGQPVTAKSIKETIEEEVSDIKARLSGEKTRSSRSIISNFFDAIGAIIIVGIKFIIAFIGGIITLVLGLLLIALFFLLLAMAGWLPGADVPVFLTKYFLDPVQLNAGIISVGIVIGVPLLLLLNKLVQRLFKTPKLPKTIRLTAISLWIFGAVMAFFTTLSVTRDFSHLAMQKTSVPVAQPSGDTLELDVMAMKEENQGSMVVLYSPDFEITDIGDSLVLFNVKVDIQRATGNEFELLRTCSARGGDGKIAQERIKMINAPMIQEGSRLRISEGFYLPAGTLYRDQEVRYILKVPEGKSVYLSEESAAIIHDIKNVTNTLDEDMAGRTWTMTPAGLECIGCGLPNLSVEESEDAQVVIEENGVIVETSSDSLAEGKVKDVRINIGGKERIRIRTDKE